MSQPGQVKNAWRLSRTVVLPDYQGLGIGSMMTDAVAEILWREGKRVFTKTMSPALGLHRENSPLWTPTSKHRKSRPDYNPSRNNLSSKHKMKHTDRVCFCLEYKRGERNEQTS